MTLDEAMKRLAKARKRLDAEQGRVARRNAREKFLRYLRVARKAVDEEYPVIPKKSTRRRKPKLNRAISGKAEISRTAHRMLMSAGVKPHYFTRMGVPGSRGERIYAPIWMARLRDADFSYADIASAVRSIKKRRRMLTLAKLGATKP